MAVFGLRFRSRSPERDRATDAARIADIERAIEQAIASAEAEKMGLEGRMQAARADAAFLYESAEDTESRSSLAEREVAKAEQRLLSAEARLRALGDHISNLKRLQHSLLEIFKTPQ
jgi:hypothetical protein